MVSCTAHALYLFPLKGARGCFQDYLDIDPVVGVRHDRQYAIRKKAPFADEWAAKAAFYVGMNTPLMAAEVPCYDATLPRSGGINRLDHVYLRDLGARLGIEGDVRLQDTKGEYCLADAKGAFVSFLNLASVRALSEFMGADISPARFRMNVWLEGLEPFAELDWVDGFPGTREILAGPFKLRVDDACERCKAVLANPETGERDLDVLAGLEALMRQRGYAGSPHRGAFTVMGILAQPLTHGTVYQGDAVSFC